MIDLIRLVDAWVRTYDAQTHLTTLWCLFLGFQGWALTKLYSWRQIARQRDRTDVGRALKLQKLAEVAMGECMAIAYAAALVAHYTGYDFGVWEQLFIRILVMVGLVGAVLWGVRLVAALRRENRRAQEGRYADPRH